MLEALTHIKCKQCGVSISNQAKSCPHCGNKVTIPMLSKIAVAFFLLALAFIIFKPDDNQKMNAGAETSPPVAIKTAASHPFKAEDIVTFPQSAIACVSRDNFARLMQFSLSGEATKARSMMVGNGGDCVALDSHQKFKIIHVEYNDAEHPDFGLAEIVGAQIKSSDAGAWTFTMVAQLAN